MTLWQAFIIATAAGLLGAVLTLAGIALILTIAVQDEVKREEERYRSST